MAENGARGWLMDVGGRWRLAVGAHCVVEYLLSPPTHALPRMPVHCLGAALWQEKLIPILDLGPVLSERPRARERAARAVVLAYQELPGQPLRYGALVVRSAPVEVWASDEMACPLPEHAALEQFSRSCFAHGDEAIPVLDAKMLFATALTVDPPELREEMEDKREPVATAIPADEPRCDIAEPEPVREPELSVTEPLAPVDRIEEREIRPADEPDASPAVLVLPSEAAQDTSVPADAPRHRPFTRKRYRIGAAVLAIAALAAVLIALWLGF